MADLKTDILSRPETSGMARVGDHIGILNYYNAPREGVTSLNTSLSQTALVKWAAAGRYSKLVEGQTTGTPGAKSRCYAMVDVLRNFTAFDATDTQLSGVVNTMVNDGVLSSGDQSAFNLLLIKNPSSYAESVFGKQLNLNEVSTALNG